MDTDLLAQIRDLFASQRLAVLATSQQGQPYTSLVAFAFSEDLLQLYFATTRATRKFVNLQSDPRASLLIDSRNNRSDDFREAVAVTALGSAREVTGRERQRLMAAYLMRHPSLEEFVRAPTCALLRIKVRRYALVSRFQNVLEISFEGGGT
jgi:nitroimidazol reductase NimA-like FMN-containing flavoprotein (pyridoxamine 5'-phosphate oxidase superfamily)